MNSLDELIRVGKIEELPGQYLLDAAATELSALRQRIAELEGERDALRGLVDKYQFSAAEHMEGVNVCPACGMDVHARRCEIAAALER